MMMLLTGVFYYSCLCVVVVGDCMFDLFTMLLLLLFDDLFVWMLSC